MCILESNAVADRGFDAMGTRDKAKFEQRCAKLADLDSVSYTNGLSLLVHSVSDWSMLPELRAVRKLRIGRHRFYFLGKHTDCRYTVVFVLPNKREEDDKPETYGFQRRIFDALREPASRVIHPRI